MATATCQPCSAKHFTVALPMPELVPVMTMVFMVSPWLYIGTRCVRGWGGVK